MRAPWRYEPPPMNDRVEAQRPGYCLEHIRTGQFVTGIQWGAALPTGARCRMVKLGPPKDAHVFSSRYDAIQALDSDYRIVTPPRHNGFCLEWQEAKP